MFGQYHSTCRFIIFLQDGILRERAIMLMTGEMVGGWKTSEKDLRPDYVGN